MGRMSIEFLIERIDLGRSQASEYLDESPFDSLGIDLVRRVWFVTADDILYP
jgi:hypothetical protein